MSDVDPRHPASVVTDCREIIYEEMRKRGRA
jgi:hypothetical protein